MTTRSAFLPLIFTTTALICASPAQAIVIDNDIASGTLGHWSVDVENGGESGFAGSSPGNLTASGLVSGTVTENVLYDYFSYVDVGGGGFQLSSTAISSAVASTGDDQVSSSGSFTGSAGNTIDWSVVSEIPDGGSVMTSTFDFTAQSGTLGDLRFFQYLDEDVLGVSDDVFFTRGSVAGLDLELFTVDNDEVIGVSHSGALDGSQGLINSTFAGWAACTFDTMRPAISGGTQTVSPSGDVCAGLAGSSTTVPIVGSALGPLDIVSSMAWDVSPDASSATIITTLGGVPEASDIPDDNGTIPAPATLVLMGTGLLGIGLAGRRRKAQR